MTRVPSAKMTQLASLDLHSRDIYACVLLDSNENIVKRVRVYVNTCNERIWDFSWFSILVWQLFFSCWKWREFLSLYKVLNLGIWKISCYILLSVYNVFFVRLFVYFRYVLVFLFCILFCFLYLFNFFVLFFIYLECSTPFYGKIRAVHMYVKCLI